MFEVWCTECASDGFEQTPRGDTNAHATFVVSQDMSHHQGAAYAKLFRWVQRECASRLSRGQPEVEPMLQKAVAKLTKRHDADPSQTQHAKELVVQVSSTPMCALFCDPGQRRCHDYAGACRPGERPPLSSSSPPSPRGVHRLVARTTPLLVPPLTIRQHIYVYT